MSQPEAWTPEKAESLGAIGRGDCPHDNTIDVADSSTPFIDVYCTDCRTVVATMNWSDEE